MPRRKALLIGINYFGTPHELKGCINDAANVRQFLVEDKGYSPEPGDMVMMTDEPSNRGTPFEPTGENMLEAFKWLVTGNRPGDMVWLSYSGHGGKKPAAHVPYHVILYDMILSDSNGPELTLIQAKSKIRMETASLASMTRSVP